MNRRNQPRANGSPRAKQRAIQLDAARKDRQFVNLGDAEDQKWVNVNHIESFWPTDDRRVKYAVKLTSGETLICEVSAIIPLLFPVIEATTEGKK